MIEMFYILGSIGDWWFDKIIQIIMLVLIGKMVYGFCDLMKMIRES